MRREISHALAFYYFRFAKLELECLPKGFKKSSIPLLCTLPGFHE
jgi:hypothetical protein